MTDNSNNDEANPMRTRFSRTMSRTWLVIGLAVCLASANSQAEQNGAEKRNAGAETNFKRDKTVKKQIAAAGEAAGIQPAMQPASSRPVFTKPAPAAGLAVSAPAPLEDPFSAQPPAPKTVRKPFYKKRWFWSVVGTVLAGSIVAITVATTSGGDERIPYGPDGTFSPEKLPK
jgi:hypothetical protein